jgi:2'-5' RNA ligase
MSNLAIVAVPAEDDYVHKISSEKVPHCTLLFLGDVEGKPVHRIASFLQHAVEIMELGPFGLEVDYRGTLGEDEADVLYFKKGWSAKRIEQFRGQLLKNNEIRDAYDSTEQFPGWLPHLTLGYPRTPAREDKRDYPGIRWVEFDRIAIWQGEYEGPEFRLEYNYHNDLAEVAMSIHAERGRGFLEHYGVMGMKWGVRNVTSGKSSTPVTTTTTINKGLRSKTKIKGTGGKGSPAAEDAIKAATTKQKLKKSGPAALSNTELRDLATRLQLEQQVSQLATPKGQKFVKNLVKTEGQNQVRREFSEAATAQVKKAKK